MFLLLTDLPTGRIDAIVLDEVVANYMLKKNQINMLSL